MTKEKVQQIDAITHHTLGFSCLNIIDELMDQGFEEKEIREYLEAKHSSALRALESKFKYNAD